MSISSTQPDGAYFSFFGRSRQQAKPPVHLSCSSSRNNDLMTIYRNISHIILSSIPNNFQQSHQYLSYWQPTLLLFILPNLSINNPLTLLLPYPGAHFPLTKISQKYTSIPSPTYTNKSLIFHTKYLKMA